MFTRVVELRSKSGKVKELCSAASDKVLPILRKQQGFQDEILLVSITDSNRMLALSFWNRREDAERYHREQFAQVTTALRNFIDGEPIVATYEVNTSTVHHINLGKAA